MSIKSESALYVYEHWFRLNNYNPEGGNRITFLHIYFLAKLNCTTQNGYSCITDEDLANCFKVTTSVVKQTLHDLELDGLINIEYPNGNRRIFINYNLIDNLCNNKEE